MAVGAGEGIGLRLRVVHGDAIALGPGKAALLEAISATGSIAAAARSLAMSYRRAWLLVETMNSCFVGPMVATQPGARHGATLTPLAEQMIAAYRAAEQAASDAAEFALIPVLAALSPLR